jgi:glycosyltransferase involved in cell wall biosynthesis
MPAPDLSLEVSDAIEPASTGKGGAVARILHLNAGNLYGGVESMLTTIARMRHLCPGMEPHFVTCFEGRSSRELVEAGVPVHVLGPVRVSRPWTVWRARKRLRRILQAQRFDLVVCHMDWTLVVFSGVARAAGNRVALWAHGWQTRENWLGRMARRLKPDLAIANSHFTEAIIRERFPDTPARVIYCPVTLVESPEADKWRAALRQEHALDDATTVILQVSRLEAWKGHAVLLQALSKLKSKSKWVCWIVGGPQTGEEEAYFRQIQETASQFGLSGRVKFFGQRSDVPRLFAASDIYCQPNQAPEPFGLSFVEALWAGRPVISSALGGALEIVDPSCGVLVEPGDADGLAATLDRLIDSPELRRTLGSAGAGRARELCDPGSQLNKLKELARELVRRPEGVFGA